MIKEKQDKKKNLNIKLTTENSEQAYQDFILKNYKYQKPLVSWTILFFTIFKLVNIFLIKQYGILVYITSFFAILELILFFKIYFKEISNFIFFCNAKNKKSSIHRITFSFNSLNANDIAEKEKSYFIPIRIIFLIVDLLIVMVFIVFYDTMIENQQYILIKFIYLSIFIKNLICFWVFSFKVFYMVSIHVISLVMLVLINIKIPLLFYVKITTNDGIQGNKNIINNFEKQNIFSVMEILFESILFWVSLLIIKNSKLQLRNLFSEYTEINHKNLEINQKIKHKNNNEINRYSQDLLEGLSGFQVRYFKQKLIFISQNIRYNFLNIFNSENYQNNHNNHNNESNERKESHEKNENNQNNHINQNNQIDQNDENNENNNDSNESNENNKNNRSNENNENNENYQNYQNDENDENNKNIQNNQKQIIKIKNKMHKNRIEIENENEKIDELLKNLKNCKNDKLNLLDFIELFNYKSPKVLEEKEIELEKFKFSVNNKNINSNKVFDTNDITFKKSMFSHLSNLRSNMEKPNKANNADNYNNIDIFNSNNDNINIFNKNNDNSFKIQDNTTHPNHLRLNRNIINNNWNNNKNMFDSEVINFNNDNNDSYAANPENRDVINESFNINFKNKITESIISNNFSEINNILNNNNNFNDNSSNNTVNYQKIELNNLNGINSNNINPKINSKPSSVNQNNNNIHNNNFYKNSKINHSSSIERNSDRSKKLEKEGIQKNFHNSYAERNLDENHENSQSKLILLNNQSGVQSGLSLNSVLNAGILDDKKKLLNCNEQKNSCNNHNFFTALKYLKSEKILDINFKNLELTVEKVLEENQERTNKFQVLGEFSIMLEGYEEESFFLVYFRRSETSLDIYFTNITKIKKNENILTENKLKHKILSKIAHEFKTPLNSILGLAKNIKEINYNKNINKDLNLIQALSNYTIYLISDVIQYASNETKPYNSSNFNFSSNQNQNLNNFIYENNKKNNHSTNFINSSINSYQDKYSIYNNENNNNNNYLSSVIKRKVEVRKSMFFCFDILNALLSCHESKKYLIKTELLLENNFNDFEILNDEIRTNQIILNLISNSVKFTRKGKIAIVVQFIKRKDLSHNINELNQKYTENVRSDKIDKENVNNDVTMKYNTARVLFKSYLDENAQKENDEKILHSKTFNITSSIDNNNILDKNPSSNNTNSNSNNNFNSNSNNQNSNSTDEEIYFLKVSVIDTGMGITEKNQKKIFNQNLRMNTKHDFNQQGSGLGLSICLSLVKMLNLKIEYFSEVNKGSSFSLLIPAKKIKIEKDEAKFRDRDSNINNITKDSIVLKKNASKESSNEDKEEMKHSDKCFPSSNSNEAKDAVRTFNDENSLYSNNNSNKNNVNKKNIADCYPITKVVLMQNVNKIAFNKIRTIEEINNSQEQNNSYEKISNKQMNNEQPSSFRITNNSLLIAEKSDIDDNKNDNLNDWDVGVEKKINAQLDKPIKKSNFFKDLKSMATYVIENESKSK